MAYPKPTSLSKEEAIQYAMRETAPGSGEFLIKTDAEFSGGIEVELDAEDGDNVAIADATTGNKATVDDNKLNVKDVAVLAKMQLKAGVDYDQIQMALSSGDTVETYSYKLSGSTIKTLTVTYTDNTRRVWTNLVWS